MLIDNQNEPIGTRIFGPVARELRPSVHEDHLAGAGGAVMEARLDPLPTTSAKLSQEFGYSNVHGPQLTKIVVNMGWARRPRTRSW